jgi:hypothetical protein
MKKPATWISALAFVFALAGYAFVPKPVLYLSLDSLTGVEVQPFRGNAHGEVKVQADIANYQGRRALHIRNDDSTISEGSLAGGQSLAVVKGSDFKDGTIEVDVVGWPRQGAPPDTRGFAGVAFRLQDDASRFEAFYLRFSNGRAEDQLRRNHTAQYVSEPDFSWFRLRSEQPGVYESYVDIAEKAWARIKVVVSGSKAQLYVNGAKQPCLIVNDLKLGNTHGRIALWNGSDTEAYFSRLRIE